MDPEAVDALVKAEVARQTDELKKQQEDEINFLHKVISEERKKVQQGEGEVSRLRVLKLKAEEREHVANRRIKELKLDLDQSGRHALDCKRYVTLLKYMTIGKWVRAYQTRRRLLEMHSGWVGIIEQLVESEALASDQNIFRQSEVKQWLDRVKMMYLRKRKGGKRILREPGKFNVRKMLEQVGELEGVLRTCIAQLMDYAKHCMITNKRFLERNGELVSHCLSVDRKLVLSHDKLAKMQAKKDGLQTDVQKLELMNRQFKKALIKAWHQLPGNDQQQRSLPGPRGTSSSRWQDKGHRPKSALSKAYRPGTPAGAGSGELQGKSWNSRTLDAAPSRLGRHSNGGNHSAPPPGATRGHASPMRSPTHTGITPTAPDSAPSFRPPSPAPEVTNAAAPKITKRRSSPKRAAPPPPPAGSVWDMLRQTQKDSD